jgi:hypothetical protein
MTKRLTVSAAAAVDFQVWGFFCASTSLYQLTPTTSAQGPRLLTFGAFGKSDFMVFRKRGWFFADHTRFIRQLEEDCFWTTVMLAPPRFGKSLLLSMLKYYYDVRFAEPEFDYLFDGLEISQTPTPLKNKYHVLHIELPGAYTDNYERVFDLTINEAIRNFYITHRSLPFDEAQDIKEIDSNATLVRAARAVKEAGSTLFVLVDEYDRAPMQALGSGACLEAAKLAHAAARKPLAALLATLKGLTQEDGLIRFIVAGIQPVALIGVSRVNMVERLYLQPAFANMLGFTLAEVNAALMLVPAGYRASALAAIQQCYNGYFFAYGTEAVYNPQLVMYFVENFGDSKRIKPAMIANEAAIMANIETLADPNQDLSVSQANLVLRFPEVQRALLQACRSNAETIVLTVRNILASFDVENIDNSSFQYLYHAGIVTLPSAVAAGNPGQVVEIRVPNPVTRFSFLDKFLGTVEGVKGTASHFFAARTAEALQELLQVLINMAPPLAHQTEADLQGLLMAGILWTSKLVACAEHAPPTAAQQRMDLMVDPQDDTLIVMKPKTVWPKRDPLSQCLRKSIGPKFPTLTEDELRALTCQYTSTGPVSCATVGDVHTAAVGQVTGYKFHFTTANPAKRIDAFAVTQVVNRFIVTKLA